jgi:hypothetical protein
MIEWVQKFTDDIDSIDIFFNQKLQELCKNFVEMQAKFMYKTNKK